MSPESPWPLQPEEAAILPDTDTRDSRPWKRAVATPAPAAPTAFELTAEDVLAWEAMPTEAGQPWTFNLTLTEAASARLRKITEQRLGQTLPLVVDGKVVAEPRVQTVITGPRLTVTGSSDPDAQHLREALGRSGE